MEEQKIILFIFTKSEQFGLGFLWTKHLTSIFSYSFFSCIIYHISMDIFQFTQQKGLKVYRNFYLNKNDETRNNMKILKNQKNW